MVRVPVQWSVFPKSFFPQFKAAWRYPRSTDSVTYLEDHAEFFRMYAGLEFEAHTFEKHCAGKDMSILILTSPILGITPINVERFLELCKIQVTDEETRLDCIRRVPFEKGNPTSEITLDFGPRPVAFVSSPSDKVAAARMILRTAEFLPESLVNWNAYDAVAKWEIENRLLAVSCDGFNDVCASVREE